MFYQNDPQTIAEVDRVAHRYPAKVHKVTVGNDGPTCKADCLNWIIHDILEYERTHKVHFAGVVMHDSEDVIHPLEFSLFNNFVREADLIQLPVLSLDRKWHDFVAGTYMDDFSESHSKDIVVRANLSGLVPGAGVASCYSRQAIETITKHNRDNPFNTATLTEDYDFSFRMRDLGMRELFVHCPVTYTVKRTYLRGLLNREVKIRSYIGAREYFPSKFRAAYRQRARWILGIAFQGWQQLGWRGSLSTKYLFFHDRKTLVTSFFSVAAYAITANFAAVALLQGAGYVTFAHGDPTQALAALTPIIVINGVLFANRIAQRVYFVSKLNGIEHGLLAIPRIAVNNFINFFAACRAWKVFVLHLVTKKPIAWDKTSHTYPTSVEAGERRRTLPEILIAKGAIDIKRLEQICSLQAQSGRSLDHILLEQQCVDANILADAIAEASALPRVSLVDTAIPCQLFVASFPEDVALQYKVVPFSYGTGVGICVATYAPPDQAAVTAIGAAANADVRYFIAGAHEVIAALEIRQVQHQRKVSTFTTVSSAAPAPGSSSPPVPKKGRIRPTCNLHRDHGILASEITTRKRHEPFPPVNVLPPGALRPDPRHTAPDDNQRWRKRSGHGRPIGAAPGSRGFQYGFTGLSSGGARLQAG
ncbi:glycosyl transferase family protein [Cupriavidus basilensis]